MAPLLTRPDNTRVIEQQIIESESVCSPAQVRVDANLRPSRSVRGLRVWVWFSRIIIIRSAVALCVHAEQRAVKMCLADQRGVLDVGRWPGTGEGVESSCG